MFVDILIPSRDRPPQLDLLLRSIKKYFHNVGKIFVLFKAEKDEFIEGYFQVAERYPEVEFIPEINFSMQYKNIITEMMATDYYLGISDDCVFLQDTVIPDDFKLAKDEVALSLRMSTGNTYCQPGQFDMVPPHFLYYEPFIQWEWAKAGRGDFSYTASPDSQIYNREYFIEQVNKSGMKTLRDLEIYMDNNRPIDKPFMLSFKDLKLVSIAANTVWEGGWELPNMHVTTEELNKKWLDNYQISMDNISGLKPNACHIFLNYVFEKRK